MSKQIAIYGKGGIGKSTISSNLSAALGAKGKKILQIGCDPKHDSTLLLTKKPINTLLDELDFKSENIDPESIMHSGIFDINCIEIGGPEPGIGCAGRGIIKGIEVINHLQLITDEYDLVIYDVLGDIVCGGFFAPLRKAASEMYIVTSGEFNALFAANNLCLGFKNNSFGNVKLGGIIGNCRGNVNEVEILKKFAKEINVNLIEIIPKDSLIELCTREHIPVVAKEPNGKLAGLFNSLANNIMNNSTEDEPTPFSLNDLRQFYTIYGK